MYKASYIIILLLLCVYCNNPQISEIPGCTNKIACNFDESANLDDGSCELAEENYDCNDNCLVDVDCADECGGSAVLSGCDNACGSTVEDDCLGICNGGAVETDCGCGETASDAITGYCADGLCPDDEDPDCAGICGGDNSSCLDCCGVPNGDGSTCDGECGPCNDNIDEGRCNCENQREDCAGECGGSNIIDACGNCGDFIVANVCHDCLGVPNGDAVEGCDGVCGGSAVVDDCGVCGGDSYLDYELVWQDEFEGNGLDLDKWNIEEWPAGAFNEEEQSYTDEIDNIYLENGNLHIRALRETYDFDEDEVDDAMYTSGRITTKHKGDWQFAKVEIKARLPLGAGTWPAIWMQPTENTYGGWPESGEIDIMEHVGKDPGKIHSSIHNALFYKELDPNHPDNVSMQQHQTSFINVNDVDSLHIYSMIWRKDKITFYVDDEEIIVYNNLETGFELWPFDQTFYLILNLAIGGTWGGTVAPGIFPVEYIVDYVRVYQKPCD